MATLVEVTGYTNFVTYIENLTGEDSTDVYFWFSGSKTANGDSWCPDCVEAEPVIKAFLTELSQSVTIVYVDVGDREYWKDKACPFRTDKRSRLLVIPTLMKHGGVQRLEGEQCSKRELLQMMFEQEDE